MDLLEYFQTHGEYTGANMYLITKDDIQYFYAVNSRIGQPPRFYIDGYLKDEEKVTKGLFGEHFKN